jgi:hypothetical protein
MLLLARMGLRAISSLDAATAIAMAAAVWASISGDVMCLQPSNTLLGCSKAAKQFTTIGAHILSDGREFSGNVLDTSTELDDGDIGPFVLGATGGNPPGCTATNTA